MFITAEDYKVVIGEAALKIVTQTDEQNRANAEAEALEEIAGYLRPKWDCTAAFALEGEQRNRQLVMYACDIALYHMVSAMPQKMGSEIRKERYDRAIRWLEGVQAGKIIPDMPTAQHTVDEASAGNTLYSSQTQLQHNW